MQNYEKRFYTLQQIADSMERPRSTLNEWRKLFSEYIPSVGEGRQRRYKREALSVFETISRMKEANETNDQIRDYLSQMVDDITISVDTSKEDTPPPLLRQMYDSYTNLLEQNERLEQRMDAFQRESREREELLLQKIDELSAKLESPKQQELDVHNETSTTDNDDEQETKTEAPKEKKGFWKKLFK